MTRPSVRLILTTVIALLAVDIARAQPEAPRENSRENLPSKLPLGPAPTQALAIADRQGNVTMKAVATSWIQRSFKVPETQEVRTYYEPVVGVQSRQHLAEHVAAHDSDGRPIERKRLVKLLQDETQVMVSANAKSVDPLHCRVYRKDTIFLVLTDPGGALAAPAFAQQTYYDVNPAPAPAPVPVPPPFPPPPGVVPQGVPQAMPPKLAVQVIAPEKHVAASDAEYLVVIVNQGGRAATNVAVQVKIPDSLAAPGSKLSETRWLVATTFDVLPGAAVARSLKLTGLQPGESQLQVKVSADGNVTAETESRVTIVAVPKEPPK